MLELLRRTLGEKIEVSFRAEDDLWPVRADLSQLEAAIVNLAVNARDAMPGGGRLDLAMSNSILDEEPARGRKLGGDYVLISVKDTGTGMPPHVLERVFEPFFTTKESGKGTGLGLSMVYGFVQQSGGHIALDSAPDRGTTIRIYLPRVVSGAAGPVLRAVGGDAPAAAGGAETILVVEDDSEVRQVTVATLEALGYRIRAVGNAADALAALEEDANVHLLLTDIRMPGTMTGVELAQAVSATWPTIKILLISGYVDAEEDVRDFNLLDKPFRAADLARTIRGLLDQAQALPPVREIAPAREVA
jgi:CheY-like chemotaxis protein